MRGAAAELAGALLRGGELAGAGRSAATGARLGRGLVQTDELGMGCPLGTEGGAAGLGAGSSTARAARRHGEPRRRAVPGQRSGLRPN